MKGPQNIQFACSQEKYFKTKDNRYLTEMYLLCAEVAANCIKSYAWRHHIYLNVDELAHDVAATVINRYLENTNFKIDSMIGYVFLRTKGILFKDKEWEKRKVSFEDWMQEAAV
jgi:hypothetical protein